MKLYRAGSICSSIRSIMPAKLIRTVVLNLSFVRLAQDKGDIVASVEIRLMDIKGVDVSEDIWCA